MNLFLRMETEACLISISVPANGICRTFIRLYKTVKREQCQLLVGPFPDSANESWLVPVTVVGPFPEETPRGVSCGKEHSCRHWLEGPVTLSTFLNFHFPL